MQTFLLTLVCETCTIDLSKKGGVNIAMELNSNKKRTWGNSDRLGKPFEFERRRIQT